MHKNKILGMLASLKSMILGLKSPLLQRFKKEIWLKTTPAAENSACLKAAEGYKNAIVCCY